MDFRDNLITRIEKWATIFFFSASVFVMFLLMQALILAWLSQFKIIYLLLSVIISFILTIIFFFFIKKDINALPRLSIYVLIVIFLVCLIGILFPHDTLGGRDEGVYAGHATMLSKNYGLSIPTYLFNAPITYSSSEISFSVPVYIVWLATQKVFFGIDWMLRSNVILVFLGLCSLYFVSSIFIKKSLSFIIVALFSSTMPFLWFMRETMSENLSFFLLWTSIVFLFTFFRTKRNIYLVGLILGTWLFSFTRLEGMLIQLTAFLVFLFILLITKAFSLRRKLLIIFIYITFIASSFLISKPFSYNSYFAVTRSHVEHLLQRSIPSVQVRESIRKYSEVMPKEIKLANRIPIFVMQMLAKYNLVIVLFSILLIIPLLSLDKKITKESKINIIGLLIIISPEFYKFIDPSVTMEQPWMYRRYLYALLPMGYLCFSILTYKLLSRKSWIILFGAFLIINILLSSKIIMLKNNWGISRKMEKITQNISSNDFVIVENYNVLDNYYPGSYIIYHKEARAIFNEVIVKEKWSPREHKYMGIPYNKLFLLSEKEDESYKDFKLIKINSMEVEFKQLDPNCKLNLLKTELGLEIDSLTSLPYSNVISHCNKTDNEILEVNKKIFLYELINKI